jgi:tyrosine-protein kinase Etk/Wzc
VLGLALGVAGIFVRKALGHGAEDEAEIEESTGLRVFVTVPHSHAQSKIGRAARRKGGASPLLASVSGNDLALECLRSLRTRLQVAFTGAPNRLVALTSPGPSAGKSFISANLASALATFGWRTLLVDADLRRGRLHQHFGQGRKPGLSELLRREATLEECVFSSGVEGFDVLPSGSIPTNPADLLGSTALGEVLTDALTRYAVVIVDTPPALVVTDAVLLGRLAGVNLMVVRAGQSSVREINLTAKLLEQGGVHVDGVVLNDVHVTGGRHGRYGRYRNYEYGPVSSD